LPVFAAIFYLGFFTGQYSIKEQLKAEQQKSSQLYNMVERAVIAGEKAAEGWKQERYGDPLRNLTTEERLESEPRLRDDYIDPEEERRNMEEIYLDQALGGFQ
jgi:hypothetical protein